MNYPRAVLVCLPHCGATMFWTAFYYLVPLVLTNLYGFTVAQYSLVLSLNNLIALAVVPAFGALSDRLSTPLGRRGPLILLGSVGAVAGILAMGLITNLDHARQNPAPGAFLAALFITMFFINLYRTPAYSLISDCFVRRLHTRSNAVITVMAGLSGVLFNQTAGVLLRLENGYSLCFGVIAAIITAMSGGYLLLARENRYLEEVRAAQPPQPAATAGAGTSRLDLLLAVLTAFFVFMGYNAFNAHYSQYLTRYLLQDEAWTLPATLRTLLNLVFALPAGLLASRAGRERTTIAGLMISIVGYLGAFTLTPANARWILLWFVLFSIGYPVMSVSLNPMIVAFSRGGHNGRFTSIYLLIVTSAQILTTMLSAQVIERFGLRYLVVYCVVCFFIALAACLCKLRLRRTKEPM